MGAMAMVLITASAVATLGAAPGPGDKAAAGQEPAVTRPDVIDNAAIGDSLPACVFAALVGCL
jgi:hypothetical protein